MTVEHYSGTSRLHKISHDPPPPPPPRLPQDSVNDEDGWKKKGDNSALNIRTNHRTNEQDHAYQREKKLIYFYFLNIHLTSGTRFPLGQNTVAMI